MFLGRFGKGFFTILSSESFEVYENGRDASIKKVLILEELFRIWIFLFDKRRSGYNKI